MAIGDHSQADGDNTTAIGTNAKALAENASAVGAGATVASTAINGSAFGTGANVLAGATNSVALGNGSVANEANTVSVGSVGNERRITNVADGRADHDAANMGQLREIQNQSNTALAEIDKTNVRVNRVGALSAAMASLKPYYVDGTEKGQVMAGVGAYHGERALALGYGYAPNDKVFLNASVGVSKSDAMYGMGATFRIGAGESLVKKNNQAMANLQEENEQLQNRVDKLEQLVNALLAEKSK